MPDGQLVKGAITQQCCAGLIKAGLEAAGAQCRLHALLSAALACAVESILFPQFSAVLSGSRMQRRPALAAAIGLDGLR